MKSFFSSIFFFCNFLITAQSTITVDDFILFSGNSVEAEINKKNLKINEFENALFRKSFLPSLSLDLSLPNYNRSISEVLQPDGSLAFRESNTASSRINLLLTQKLPFTGGQISISNSFNRLDIFGDTQNLTSYSASWLGASLNQPLNFFNEMKWERRTNDIKLELDEIKNKKVEIELKTKTVEHFFNLLQVKTEKELLNQEIQIARDYEKYLKNLIVTKRRFSFDSIDIKLKILKKVQEFNFIEKQEVLKIKYLNDFFKNRNKKIIISDELSTPFLEIKLEDSNYYIEKFLEIFKVFEKNRLIGLEKNIKKLASSRFYDASLSVGFGLNNSTQIYSQLLNSPNQSQSVSFSLSAPILDFGKRKIEGRIANIQYDVATINLSQEKILTIQKIEYLCEEIRGLQQALDIEEQRGELLKIKIERMRNLLFAERVLLKDFSDIENDLFVSKKEKINIILSIYTKLLELESITLIKLI